MIKGNKGEWSEVYTLFKLLGDKELFLGDKDLKKLEGIVYPILKVLRTENTGNFEYSIEDNIVVISGGMEILKIPIAEFKEKALFLLEKIKTSNESTFSIPEIEDFMKTINCYSLKANSSSKTDITIVIHDLKTNQEPTLGFSIKSQLGNPSTLLNAGKTTNFIFKVSGKLTDSEIEEINLIDSKSKIKDRINRILELKNTLQFVKTQNEVFSNNLILIDSRMPEILSEMVLQFFINSDSGVKEILDQVSSKNPLNYDTSNNHRFYDYKLKRFLTDVALGMMPSSVWTGQYDATGGYLVVKEDGEVLCYHIYNRNQFEDYLLNNTKFETASSTRHDYGSIYEENGQLFFKLNLQIRFKK